ncbi:MAG: hypothetical protein JSV89_11615 [Spirochaetaceae bacterium]|nr:MAG: hypothetical protein JSV89_11615 [Spirochaetaceae bacterium]
MKIYRPVSLILCIVFAVVGLLFLCATDRVLIFFNILSSPLGMLPSPVWDLGYYPLLAGGYMYLVTLLAFFMYRHPENRSFPLLLAHGKLATSILSLALFIFHEQYLIYIANFIIDGIIGVVVMLFFLNMKKKKT